MFEYMQLISPGDNLFSVDFITRVALLIFSGLILIAVGYKIKGMRGAVGVIVLGSLFSFQSRNPENLEICSAVLNNKAHL